MVFSVSRAWPMAFTAICGWLALAWLPLFAQTDAAASAEEQAFVKMLGEIEGSLKPQTGDIKIAPAKATLRLGDDYYFLDQNDSRRVLVDAWGNPPGAADGVLGMVFAKNTSFLDPDGWGAVITFDGLGYVDDDDAESTDYDELMIQMKEGEADRNASLRAAGYQTSTLVGWAERPVYDSKLHSMIWARDIKFEGSPQNTLNYDVRLLGRYGVLSMNMVSTMPELAEIRTAANALRQSASFDNGARYADFDSSTDSVAEFGVGGLVAAGVGVAAAKKLGILGVLLAFGKKFFVFIFIAIAAAWRWLGGLFRRREDDLIYEDAADLEEYQADRG